MSADVISSGSSLLFTCDTDGAGEISECWVYYATSHSSISVPENMGQKLNHRVFGVKLISLPTVVEFV
jgi:hypothetical protein